MLITLGVDFHTADVATRERFQLAPQRLEALAVFVRAEGAGEVAHVGTCNRSELHLWYPAADAGSGHSWLPRIVSIWTGAPNDAMALATHVTVRTGFNAARHVVRVAAALESAVLGDSQILGQMRRAHVAASAAGLNGPVLHRLFETALRAGRYVQAQTALSAGASSVGAQAALLARRHLGSLTNARVAVVGCGKMGERAARQFVRLGARNIVLLNRTPSRAAELAAELCVSNACMDDLHRELASAQVSVIATGSRDPVVHAHMLTPERARAGTSHSPLLLIDVSMPRNVDTAVAALPGVTVTDIDAIQSVIEASEAGRRESVPAAEAIVEAELRDFTVWLIAASAREAVRPLREALAAVCQRELAYATNDEVAERITNRIIAKVLAEPMQSLRGALERGETVDEISRSVHLLFSPTEQCVITR